MTGQGGIEVFPELWKKLAKLELGETNLTIDQLEKELTGTDKAAFEKLKKLAEVVSGKPFATLAELKEAIKPESIIARISTLKNEDIEDRGGDAFIEYLLCLLEFSCKETGENYMEKLKQLQGQVKLAPIISAKIDEVLKPSEQAAPAVRPEGSAI